MVTYPREESSTKDKAKDDSLSVMEDVDVDEKDWISCSFDKYFSFIPTNTYSRDQLTDHGEVGDIHYGDVLIKYGDVLTDADEIPRLKSNPNIKDKAYLQEKDVLIADTAEDETVGKAVQVGKVSIPLIAGLHTIACRPNFPTADGFLGYYINSSQYHNQLYPYITGIKVSSVSKKSIAETVLTIPSDIREQKAIVDILSTIDSYINNLTKLIEKKKAIRDGALEDLMSGRTRLEGFESEWDSCKIGDILKILHGKNQKAVESCNGKYPILGTGGIIGKSKKYLCNWECVLIGRKGTIDRPVYMNSPFWTIDTLYYSKPMPNQCVKFQYYLFCTINWHDYTESSGRPSLSKKVVENIDIKIPSYEEQCAISKTLTSMNEEIESLEAEQEKMIQIREGAMDDLLTGRVRLLV